MKLFASKLQCLNELYQRVKAEIADPARLAQTKDSAALIQAVLKNKQLLAQIEQMTGRTGELAHEWAKCRALLDPQLKEDIQTLAAEVRGQAEQLAQVCRALVRQIDARRSELQKELAEISNGIRYLSSVKPSNTNYPKFIDSVG